MKGILFFLNLFFLISCDSKRKFEESEKFDVIKHLDSAFVLAHDWSESKPPIPDGLLESLDSHLVNIKIHRFNNPIEPNTLIFSAQKKNQLEILAKTPTLKNLNKVSYQSYIVWRSIIENKEILEFSLQPHPTLSWTFTIRKRDQE